MKSTCTIVHFEFWFWFFSSLKYFLQTHTWHIVSVTDFKFFFLFFLFLKYLSLQTHTRHIVSVTDTLAEKPISDLPGEDARALRLCFAKSYFHFPFCKKKLFTAQHLLFSSHLVFWDLFDHSWRGNPRFWATDLTGLDAAGLVVPATNNYNVERQWKLQGVTSAQGKFYLVLRRKFHQSLV